MQLNIQEILEFAKQIAIQGGKIAMEYYGSALKITHKDVINNLVTEADLTVENYLIDQISNKFPTHQIIAEESGISNKKNEYTWLIDPIDGTTNFAHNYPFFAISIGLYKENTGILGVIFAPKLNELFYGTPEASYLNNQQIKVSKCSSLELSLLGTGFPPNRSSEDYSKSIQLFTRTQRNIHGVRRSGSACLDLCYTACGRLDGFFEIGLKPWDTGAGTIILQGAGGRVTDFDNQKFSPYGNTIIATNSQIHEELFKFLQ